MMSRWERQVKVVELMRGVAEQRVRLNDWIIPTATGEGESRL